MDVTASPAIAFLNLATGGSQAIANVGVSNVHATGQRLAPTLTNQGGSGNAVGWFGGLGPALPPERVPALSTTVLLALIAAFLFAEAPPRRLARRAVYL